MAGSKGSKYYNKFLRYNLWLEQNGEEVISPEQFELLKLIDTCGSLKNAANKIGISYRKAWGSLRDIEQVFGFKMFEKIRGGKSGGKTELTTEGKKLIESYELLISELDNAISDIAKDFFNKINN